VILLLKRFVQINAWSLINTEGVSRVTVYDFNQNVLYSCTWCKYCGYAILDTSDTNGLDEPVCAVQIVLITFVGVVDDIQMTTTLICLDLRLLHHFIESTDIDTTDH
jgi:hypothetical protein